MRHSNTLAAPNVAPEVVAGSTHGKAGQMRKTVLLRTTAGLMGVVTGAVVALAVMPHQGTPVPGSLPHSASVASKSGASVARTAEDGSVIKFSPATQTALHRLMSTPRGRANLLRALQVSFGQRARITASPPTHSSRIQLDATCAPGIACGLSSSGGWHFWIITSYASAESADLWALQPYCWAALVPETGPVGAAACLGIGGLLWEMVNNWPRMTNHGVWLAVYWWGIQDGRY